MGREKHGSMPAFAKSIMNGAYGCMIGSGNNRFAPSSPASGENTRFRTLTGTGPLNSDVRD